MEDVGASGVSVSDHIFFTSGGRPRTDGVGHGCDPLTTLAAVAGLSDRLAVQSVVVNSAWVHPGLLLRSFAQLAVLLKRNNVRQELRLQQRYEKPNEERRRKKSERHRRRFADMVRKKVQLVMAIKARGA